MEIVSADAENVLDARITDKEKDVAGHEGDTRLTDIDNTAPYWGLAVDAN